MAASVHFESCVENQGVLMRKKMTLQPETYFRFGKNVVKSFYTAGILFDVVDECFEMSPENAHARKYAKWKAAHIHSCLKNGQTPIAGPVGGMDDEGDETEPSQPAATGGEPAPGGGWLQPQIPPSSTASSSSQHPQQPNMSFGQPVHQHHHPAFQPVAAAEVPAHPSSTDCHAVAEGMQGLKLTPEMTQKAQKFCKYAVSALDYDDRNTAIDYMNKALNILKTGKEE